MLLLEKESVSGNGGDRKIVLVSQRETVLQNIGQLLRTNGIDYVDEINTDFFSDTKLTLSAEEVAGVIVDVGEIREGEKQVQTVVDAIYGLIPQNVWCCVLGDNNTISTAQQFLDQGILYFHLASQTEKMVQQVIDGISVPNIRNSVSIHVLGCKGGIGNTFISSHAADLIAEFKKVSVLLTQSDSGSSDLDLAFGKRILPGNTEEYSDNLKLFIGDTAKLRDDMLKKFNFIVHDLPIFNKKKDDYSHILNQGSNFVLVVERKISSIRTAKQFLDEYKRVQQTSPKPRRVFVCINDHRSDSAKLMAVPDIERLLEASVDVVIPFIRKPAEKVLDTDLGKAGKVAMNDLVMRLLGIISRRQKKASKSILVSLYRYLMNA